MDKRITSIMIKNCRGYFGTYEAINLLQGENLLIYGENGSGKSSLFKALNSFFLSSVDKSVKFIKNRYQENLDAEIKIQFSDFDVSCKQVITGTEQTYKFTDTISDHYLPFIKNASLVKGFLDYTDLLKVYYHKDAEPNLFNLIVLTLLGEHIPISSGGNFKLKKKWNELIQDSINKPYTRNDRCHRNAIEFLPVFETHLRSTLNAVFDELNRFLGTYFKELNIKLEYSLKPVTFNYGRYKNEWKINKDLRLIVIKDGKVITEGYNKLLNEARLSAIAICLYLASLHVNPNTIELKLLYLDDVFIGLDTGNRIPILNIIKNEFSDYQIFISTYDRYWFEFAKRYFEICNQGSWLNIEMYVGNDIVPSTGKSINKPIIIKGNSCYEKAIQYLHHRSAPDYPAAANYFRKALEEIIQTYMPKFEFVDENYQQFPEYKLGKLLNRTKRFFERSHNNTETIDSIIGLLNNLLHPLSHHEITYPIYKQELLSIESAFLKFKEQLIALKTLNYKCGLEAKHKVKIKFLIDNTKANIREYEIRLKEPLVFTKDSSGVITILDTQCYLDICYGMDNGTQLIPYSPNKTDLRFSYNSLEDAVDKIYHYLKTVDNLVFPKPLNYLSVIDFFDGTNWTPIIKKLVY